MPLLPPPVSSTRRALPWCAASWRIVLPLSVAFATFLHTPEVLAAPLAGAAPTTVVVPAAPDLFKVSAQGTVRDEAGQPIKGALVSIISIWSFDEGAEAPPIEFQTDAQGHFKVELSLPSRALSSIQRWLDTPEGEARLLAAVYAPGRAVLSTVLVARLGQGEAPATPDLVLQPGYSTTGRVLDEKGQPVAGAQVQAQYIRMARDEGDDDLAGRFSNIILVGQATGESGLQRALRTQTDAQGNFTLRDLPPSNVTVLLTDPRYVQTSAEFKVSATTPDTVATPDAVAAKGNVPTLNARPSGHIKGRVLYPDGKPVVGATVKAQPFNRASQASPAITDKDGRYQLNGLAAGQLIVSVAPPTPAWAPATLPSTTVTVGQEATVADITLTRGVLLTGYVREEGPKTPIVNAVVTVSPAGSSNTVAAITDAQGRYQVRAPLGDVSFSLMTPPRDYLASYGSTQIKVNAGSRTAPDFTLKKGILLTGTAKDAQGQPARGATVGIAGGYGSGNQTRVDDQGNWTLRGINPDDFLDNEVNGTVNLKIGGAWMIRDKPKVTLPSPPLALTLYPLELQDVKVRVVTPGGQPVAGARVRYKFVVEGEDSWANREATSDSTGTITLPKMRPEQGAELFASKAGYNLTQKGKVSTAGANPNAPERVRDIIMTPLDGQITGRVLDDKGQPAKDVRVALLFPGDLRGLPETSVQTDAGGHFTLQNIPQGEIVLGAARGRAFGQVTVKTGQEAELKLGAPVPPVAPQNVEMAFQQLDRALKLPQGKVRTANSPAQIAATLAAYDAPRAQKLMTDTTGKVNAQFLAMAPVTVARTNPQAAVALSKTLFPLLEEAKTRDDARLKLAIAVATTEPAWAQSVYDDVSQGVTPTDFTAPASQRYAQLAALAAALKNPDAEGWLQALTMCLPAILTERGGYLNANLKTLASGDLRTARGWVRQLELPLQVSSLSTLVTWAARRDAAAASQMLTEAEAVLARPDFPVEAVRADQYNTVDAKTLDRARYVLVRVLMRTDPKAALDLAQKLDKDDTSNMSAINELQVRLAGPNDTAFVKSAFETARDGWSNSAGAAAWLAALVSETSPQLSAEGFKIARDKLAKSSEFSLDQDGESVAYYAYAREEFDPAESRLLLENAWLTAVDRLKKVETKAGIDQPDMWPIISSMTDIPRAMIPLDPERAAEMMEFTSGNQEAQYTTAVTRTMMNKWLLADAKARRDIVLASYVYVYSYETRDED